MYPRYINIPINWGMPGTIGLVNWSKLLHMWQIVFSKDGYNSVPSKMPIYNVNLKVLSLIDGLRVISPWMLSGLVIHF